jgi:putative nucleotidyltransferase with HDIG domain
MTPEDALEIVKKNVRNGNLVKHMIAVSEIMKAFARALGENEELWELVGLLHDVDYEKTKDDFSKHGVISAEILRGVLPEEALHAIQSHNERTGVKPESKMDFALISADALSGLIIATALVMPNKKLEEVKVESLIRKFKDKSFARNVERKRILEVEKLGMRLEDGMEIALEALQRVHEKLGL